MYDLCARAARDTESSIYRTICAIVTREQRRIWEEALLQKHKSDCTHLEWLQQTPKKPAQKDARALFSKIAYLTALGVPQAELSGIPRSQHYARRLQHRRPSRLRTLGEVTRTLKMVLFLNVSFPHNRG